MTVLVFVFFIAYEFLVLKPKQIEKMEQQKIEQDKIDKTQADINKDAMSESAKNQLLIKIISWRNSTF